MNKTRLFRFMCLSAGLAFSGCYYSGSTAVSTATDTSPYGTCIAVSQACGGGNLCCPGTICVEGVCSTATTCAGTGGTCSSTSPCCGTNKCTQGVCTIPSGNGSCTASADCSGTLMCKNG